MGEFPKLSRYADPTTVTVGVVKLTEHLTVEIVDEVPGDVAGHKSVTLLVTGAYVYGYTQYESGVHRLVRVSPFDQAGARHTSFASVRVSPHFDDTQDIGITINPNDLKITTMRSQGAGEYGDINILGHENVH